MNVYNPKFPHGLNPQDLGFGVWMGHSMVLDSVADNLQYYGQQPAAGGLLVDDIMQQQQQQQTTNPMDINPTLNSFDGFNGQLGPAALTAAAVQQQQQLFNLQQQQQHQMQLQNQFNLNNFMNNQDLIMNSSNSNDDDVITENSNLVYSPDDQLQQTYLYQNYNNIYLNDTTVDGHSVKVENEVVENGEDENEDDEEDDEDDSHQLTSDNSNDYMKMMAVEFQQQQQQQLLHHQQSMQQQNQLKMQLQVQQNMQLADSKNSKHSNFVSSNNESSSGSTRDMVYKKIRPIKRPGLILKTPIAYEGISDPSAIPIQRDGMAVCEKCGAIGVKHSFYTRQRRFCSMACARGFEQDRSHKFYMSNNDLIVKGNENIKQLKDTNSSNNSNITTNNNNHKIKMSLMKNSKYDDMSSISKSSDNEENDSDDNTETDDPEQSDDKSKIQYVPSSTRLPEHYNNIIPQDEIPQLAKIICSQDDRMQTIRRKPSEFLNSYDWTPQIIANPDFKDAPVTCFRHAPAYDMWPNVVVGMKVEVENTDCDDKRSQVTNTTLANTPHSFWVATVLRICGYKGLLRYEGYNSDSSHDFWVNLCTAEVHPVGWCATRGKPLIPPRTIDKKYSDWKEFLVKELSGARTLPSTFYNRVTESFNSRFRVGLNLEVVDKNRIAQVKLATIIRIVGKRLHVRYYDDVPDDNGFWCHEDSPLIHPVGWATTVCHNLSAPQDYLDRMTVARDTVLEPNENDATMDLFKTNFQFEEYYLEGKKTGFVENMKLEAVDPLNLSSICVATVMSVLKFGYIMIRIDSYDPDTTSGDWFCYHEKSPCIFPVGFCDSNNIQLTPPKGYEFETFDWPTYLKDTGSAAASEDLFYRENYNHWFKVGMKLECADLMDPRLVCVATIARVVGRLLKVHFDGWEDEYDQWLDCESPDMYPVGWCFLTGYKLEGPRVLLKAPPVTKVMPKIMNKKKRRMRNKKSEFASKPTTSTRSDTTFLTRNVTTRLELEQFQQQKLIDSTNRSSNVGNNLKIEQKYENHDNFVIDEEDLENFEDGIEEENYTAFEEDIEMNLADYQDDSYSDTSSNRPETTTDIQINQETIQGTKIIPCLLGGTVLGNNQQIDPDSWTSEDVVEFLIKNDCGAYSEFFTSKSVDGAQLLKITKDDIINLLRMKVGPALKIYDLIQQLKCKLDPAKSRLLKANLSKSYL